jgi:virulence-associated protein VagC
MQTAEVFKNGRRHAVRLPKEPFSCVNLTRIV